jgi:hypothetical protein
MPIELVLLGFAIGALAVGAKLTSQRQRTWVERDLHTGDLRVLSGVAFRRNIYPPSIVVSRLEERGFMGKTGRGSYRMTLKGWIAVLLRYTSARRRETKHQ